MLYYFIIYAIIYNCEVECLFYPFFYTKGLFIPSERTYYMKKHHSFSRVAALICIIAMAASLFSGCKDSYTENTSFAMGSILTSKIYTDDEELGKELSRNISNVAAAADRALSATNEEAEIYILNRDGTVYASEYLEKTFSDIILMCNILGKNTDITIGKVSSLWGFATENPSLPSDSDIKEALKYVGIEKILMDDNSVKITLDEGTVIDLGAFGKGAACDCIYDTVKQKGVPVIVSMGGTVMAYGKGPKNDNWTIGIRNPSGNVNESFATLSLNTSVYSKGAVFVSTSGSYEKQFTENGKTYHHILDPKTGYPVENDLVSVSVVSSSGLSADALSTALFVNGFNDQALGYLESFSAEAVFVFSDGSYYVTEGLRDSFTLKNKDFTEKVYEEN